jgi:hypothetical protein
MALYNRSTKTRTTSMKATFDVTNDGLSALKERMVTIKFSCSDGKNRQLTFYGKEVDILLDKINEAKK